jgi:hypothetical protein
MILTLIVFGGLVYGMQGYQPEPPADLPLVDITEEQLDQILSEEEQAELDLMWMDFEMEFEEGGKYYKIENT